MQWRVMLNGKHVGQVSGQNFNEAYRAAEKQYGNPPFPYHYELESI